jgi:hypothetical protein
MRGAVNVEGRMANHVLADSEVYVKSCACATCLSIGRGNLSWGNGGLPAYGLLDLVGALQPFPGLLESALALWQGNRVPALFARAPKQGWHPAPLASRELAFRAHFLGVARAGVYPFLGLERGCWCPRDAHTCDGLGCCYICLDLDAHDGETDMPELATRVIATCVRVGMRPVAFSSRSGTGVHVFIFFDGALPTHVAAAAGAAIRRGAQAEGRCDVIPSAAHARGLGTMHALPLNPNDAIHGGGLLLDGALRPVVALARVVETLRWAHVNRSSAALVAQLAQNPSLARAQEPQAQPVKAPAKKAPKPDRERPKSIPGASDAEILMAMKASHPQFRAALDADPEKWKGGRSRRDAYLARLMRRQGMSAGSVAKALRDLPTTRSANEDPSYARAIAEWRAPAVEAMPLLPGMLSWTARKASINGRCRTKYPESCRISVEDDFDDADSRKDFMDQEKVIHESVLWKDRENPPSEYAEVGANPFWRASVQERLHDPRARRASRIDGPVLAFIIGYWAWGRGLHPRRAFFLGFAELGAHLGFKPGAVRVAATRIAQRYPDVIRVTLGVRHPTLRIATAWDVIVEGREEFRLINEPTACSVRSDDDPTSSMARRDAGDRPCDSLRGLDRVDAPEADSPPSRSDGGALDGCPVLVQPGREELARSARVAPDAGWADLHTGSGALRAAFGRDATTRF